MSHLSDKTAVVTGSSQGIGAGIAEHFAAQGANVVVNSRSADRAEAAATDIAERTGGQTVPVAADVTDEDAMTPLGRFGTVEEMARCAEFLTSTNNFVTGEVLYADGGWQAYAWGAGDQ